MGQMIAKLNAIDLFTLGQSEGSELWFEQPLPEHACPLQEQRDALRKAGPSARVAAEPTRSRRLLMGAVLAAMPSWRHPKARRYFHSTAALNAERRRQARADSFLIHPLSPLRYHWELLMGFMCLVAALVIPAKAMCYFVYMTNKKALQMYILYKFFLLLSLLVDVVFLIDVAMAHATAVDEKQTRNINLDPKFIKKNYLKTRLSFDVIIAFPYSFLCCISYPTLGAVLAFLKIFRLSMLEEALRLLLLRRKHLWYISVKITNMLLVPALTMHWLTCVAVVLMVWLGVANQSQWNHKSWLFEMSSMQNDFKTIYLRFGFRVGQLVMRVKTKRPVTMEDNLICIYTIIIGAYLFIYFAVQCLAVFRIFYVAKSQVTGKERQLKEFMTYRDLPKIQRKRLMDYFTYCFNKLYFREYQILSFVSGHLKEDIMMHSCRSAVASVSFFNDLPDHVMVRIVMCLQNEIYMENEVVVQAGTAGNSMYFIVSGTVAIISTSGNEICHLEDGAHFGEIAMLSGDETRTATVMAIETCELYCLERDDFLAAVAAYPEVLRKMEETALRRLDETVAVDKRSLHFASKPYKRRMAARHASGDLSQSGEHKHDQGTKDDAKR